jgi:hypothetical protein
VSARTVRRATLLLLSSVAFVSVGCGSSSTASRAGLRLQREDLIAVARALQGAAGEAAREAQATKAAWPLVANGVPAEVRSVPRAPIAAATGKASALRLPALFGELKARTLTGPAAGLAGEYRSYVALSATGWRQIEYAIGRLTDGPPVAAKFARDNVALYIESVYDGHFTLAQIGKQLLSGYHKLGGAATFGRTLTEAEARALAASYSEARYRLHPHVGVRLGS